MSTIIILFIWNKKILPIVAKANVDEHSPIPTLIFCNYVSAPKSLLDRNRLASIRLLMDAFEISWSYVTW